MGADKDARSTKTSRLAGGKVERGPSLFTPGCIILQDTKVVKVLPENLTQAVQHRILLTTASQRRISLLLEK